MLVLGLCGGVDALQENTYDLGYDEVHDSAAVLLRDGVVVAGIEEERLNRIKHTNKAPGGAIRFCLEQAGVRLRDVDAIAFYATESYTDGLLQFLHLRKPAVAELLTGRRMIQKVLEDALGEEADERRLRFVHHHRAHAASAWYHSGFEDALVVTLDGQGEGVSGTVATASRGGIEVLRTFTESQSLGFLYRDVIRFLGYEMFDEYKVMGMAPYGDPAPFRGAMAAMYELLPEGDYRLHRERVQGLYAHLPARRKGEPFTRAHQDLAASLQEALEALGLHVIRHFQATTGLRRLALAGGVAHNCSMNGQLVYSGLFDRVFVQPAAHDAGCAVGAALEVEATDGGNRPAPLEHVYWGSGVPPTDAVSSLLAAWGEWLSAERLDDVVPAAARLLADGKVLGWVQGRSEFGPRALGNRSIVADPRPAEHKDVVNRMVKKREAYRPFAPSVLAEEVAEYFEVPATQSDFPYMSVVLDVKPDKRTLLAAITHVDGTARVQTVDRAVNPRYWELIRAFGDLTGVPMLLNTSFNNHAEPIVESVEDAVVCFLTTGLHALVVGDHLVTKKDPPPSALLALKLGLVPTLLLRSERRASGRRVHEARFGYDNGKAMTITPRVHDALLAADGTTTVGQLFGSDVPEVVRREILELWSSRMIVLRP